MQVWHDGDEDCYYGYGMNFTKYTVICIFNWESVIHTQDTREHSNEVGAYMLQLHSDPIM